MNTQRMFIALKLSSEIVQALDRLMQIYQRQRLTAVRWTQSQNCHLTLRFLGDTSPSQAEMIKREVGAICARQRPFELIVTGSGAFPNVKRPRVIWAGIQVPPQLLQMQQELEAACRQAGFASEDKPFSPHLTLGRIKQESTNEALEQVSWALQAVHVEELGRCTVDHAFLFKSELTPKGSIYTPLAKMPFAEKAKSVN